MNAFFADRELEQQVRETGYAVVPFLDDPQVRSLRVLYDELAPSIPAEMYTSGMSPDAPYRQKVSEGIQRIVGERLRALVPHYQLCITAFTTKAANSTSGAMQLHQDWSFVDPTQHVGVNIWCPLVDVDETNGCLRVVPRSHTALGIMGFSTPNPPPFASVIHTLESEFAVSLPMSAGTAIVYDARLLHGSDENRSGDIRIATVCGIIPSGITPRLYYSAEPAPTSLEVFEVDRAFLDVYLPGVQPDGVKSLGTVTYSGRTIDETDLAKLRSPQHPVGSL